MVTKINSPITPLEQTEKTNEIIDDLNDKLYRAELNGIRSNCITEIPQNIKMELNNGIVTLKAGSKVYVPNGAGVFNAVTIDSDKTYTGGWNDVRMLCYNGHSLDGYPVSQTFSGPSAPSGQQYMMWYDTTNNIIKWTADGGSTWTDQWSLPVCIVTGGTGVVNSIDQIFNGFGYIGSTVFALPGVKGLIPDGRNADGTLKNTECSISSVQTVTITSSWGTGREQFFINGINLGVHRACTAYYISDTKPNTTILTSYWYSPKENILRSSYDTGTTWTKTSGAESFVISFSSGKVDSISSKTAFRALDYNDKGTIAGFSMPSNKYIDLTFGASGATYTAPANGWFYFAKLSNASNQYMTMYVNNTDPPIFATTITQPIDGGQARLFLPVKKGDIVGVSYNLAGETRRFCFVYAEGEV